MSRHILFCNCSGSDLIPAATRQRALEALGGVDGEVVAVDDLCRLAARDAERLRALIGDGDLLVLACHPRAVCWLLQAAGVSAEAAGRCTVLNMRTAGPEELARQLPGGQPAAGRAPLEPPAHDVDDWPAWFPVIDRGRCRKCRQCLSFCLFGVYAAAEDGGVRVAEPWNCKNHCPACARICPEAAIIFPKLDEAPINGAEIEDEDLVRANVKLNVKELLGGDVYAALRKRREKAQGLRLLKRDARERAERERGQCAGEAGKPGAA